MQNRQYTLTFKTSLIDLNYTLCDLEATAHAVRVSGEY